MWKRHTIEYIATTALCMGCGSCEAVCPFSAIQMEFNHKWGRYVPRIDHVLCRLCGRCMDVCPGRAVDFDALNIMRFGRVPTDDCMGHHIACYVGCSTNPQLRAEGASGGCITQLLSFALDRGDIDGALVVKPNDANPVEPILYLARTVQELSSSQKSIYTNVPYCSALRDIGGLAGRYAVVGLPCHLHGILKAMQFDEGLKRKIAFLFGLFCGGTQRAHAIEYYLGTKGIDFEHVRKIDYRWGGWPGKIRVLLRDGEQVVLPRRFDIPKQAASYGAAFNAFFYMGRCYSCPDKINELADVSFGDPWLEEYKNETKGLSILVSRSLQAETLLRAATNAGRLKLRSVSSNEVMVSQGLFYSRRKSSRWYILLLKLFGEPYPKYASVSLHRGGISALGMAVSEYIRWKLGRSGIPAFLLPKYFNLERHFRHVFSKAMSGSH